MNYTEQAAGLQKKLWNRIPLHLVYFKYSDLRQTELNDLYFF